MTAPAPKPPAVGSRWKGFISGIAVIVAATDRHVFYRFEGMAGIAAAPIPQFLSDFDPA